VSFLFLHDLIQSSIN